VSDFSYMPPRRAPTVPVGRAGHAGFASNVRAVDTPGACHATYGRHWTVPLVSPESLHGKEYPMSRLELIARGGGWQLIDAGKLSFWFPERDKALETVTMMADARSLLHGIATTVHAENDSGEVELVASFG
jgi:hypothetical protein